MTREEFRQEAALSAIQGVIEAKYGILAEIDVNLAADEAIRIANALTEKMFKDEKQIL